jgi:hypothetical protein
MKRIYEAANSLEAHMIVHMLTESGLRAHIQGEHLQSGAGELPLGGLVGVAVEDDDVSAATRLIKEWEARTASPPDAEQTRAASRAFNGQLLAFVIGGLVGAGVVLSLQPGLQSGPQAGCAAQQVTPASRLLDSANTHS